MIDSYIDEQHNKKVDGSKEMENEDEDKLICGVPYIQSLLLKENIFYWLFILILPKEERFAPSINE